ncbi:lysine-specific demethylase 4B, putative [Babesia caballi]|uniref:Lysine-specific demethylase 4B, putative n=1 Tax=Babesia caballi TaxID=5871 RepID=A0AAV4LSG4_BABCB|nr:lysine-specific demethylase 4B, putative [Babesia caballi]
MASCQYVFKEPDTLKATLEFLSAIRANILLRKTVCDVFTEYSGEYCNHEAPKWHRFHKFLEDSIELRSRILGQPEKDKHAIYEDYQKIASFRGESEVCDDHIDGCMIKVPKKRSYITVCLGNINACARKIAEVLLKVFPKFYNTLNSVLAKLWDDVHWFRQRCNDTNGALYKLLCDGGIHERQNCPYSEMEKLALGFRKDDINGTSRGEDIQGAINALIGHAGSLWALIVLIKKHAVKTASLPLYAAIGTKTPYNTRCLCIERKVEAGEETSYNSYRSSRQTRSSADRSSGNTRTRGRTRRSAPVASVTVNPKIIANSDASEVTDTRVSVTATSVAVGTPTVSASITKPGNTYATPSGNQADVPQTGSGYPNGDIMYFHSLSSSYSSHQTPTLQETRLQEVRSSTGSGSNRTACGAAAGLLAVGCVGVGAAYVFDIGGFGTMVNGMF